MLFNRSSSGTFAATPKLPAATETVRARLAAAEAALADKSLGERCLAAALSDMGYRPAETELAEALTRIALLQRALAAAEAAERDQLAEAGNRAEQRQRQAFAEKTTALATLMAAYRKRGVVD